MIGLDYFLGEKIAARVKLGHFPKYSPKIQNKRFLNDDDGGKSLGTILLNCCLMEGNQRGDVGAGRDGGVLYGGWAGLVLAGGVDYAVGILISWLRLI